MSEPVQDLMGLWSRGLGEPLGSFPAGSAVPKVFEGKGSPLVGGLVQGGIGAALGYGAGSLVDDIFGKDEFDPGRRKRRYATIAGAVAASPNLFLHYFSPRPANLTKASGYFGEPLPVPIALTMSEVNADPNLDPFAKARISSMLQKSYEDSRSPFTSARGIASVAAQSIAGAYLLPRVIAGIFGGLSGGTRDTLRQVGILGPILNAVSREGVL